MERDWKEIFQTYGLMKYWQSFLLFLTMPFFFSTLTLLFLLYFDVVSSALYNLHEPGTAADQRIKGLEEIVRVLKPGGFGVVWDLQVRVLEYRKRLHQLGMEYIQGKTYL
jgi:hypothetical protein